MTFGDKKRRIDQTKPINFNFTATKYIDIQINAVFISTSTVNYLLEFWDTFFKNKSVGKKFYYGAGFKLART